MDPVSGKRNHWLSENGSTLPITSSHNSATKTVTGDNHDKCSHRYWEVELKIVTQQIESILVVITLKLKMLKV